LQFADFCDVRTCGTKSAYRPFEVGLYMDEYGVYQEFVVSSRAPWMIPISALDQISLPRSYKASWGWRAYLTAVSVGGVGFAVWGVWDFLKGPDAHKRLSALLAAFFALLIIAGIYTLLFSFKMNVTLTYDAIELQNIVNRRRMLRSEVARWRIGRTRYMDFLVLEPSGQGKKLKVPMVFKSDPSFQAWLRSLPHLETEQSQAV
jgi:hypothetical protein